MARSQDAARANAIFHVPEVAFDRGLRDVPAHVFADEARHAMNPDAATGLVALDLAPVLRMPMPATTPAMLARYVVVRAGERLEHRFLACGEVYYVIRGTGRSASGRDEIDWKTGDVFVLPSDATTAHEAAEHAVLMCITNEPELSLMGTRPRAEEVVPAFFDAHMTNQKLDLVHRRTGDQRTAGKSVIYATPPFTDTRTVTPTITASMNTLEPGGDQRPHLHNAAALTLSIEGEGVHSMVGSERVDWQPHALVVTPARAPHSHHNRGSRMMKSFVVQDSGLYYRLRNPGFQWTD